MSPLDYAEGWAMDIPKGVPTNLEYYPSVMCLYVYARRASLASRQQPLKVEARVSLPPISNSNSLILFVSVHVRAASLCV